MKRRKDKGAMYTFILMPNWINLQYTVCGFFGFAECILANSKYDIYIPMLLSNTSFLEALFSHICSLGGRDARSYPTRIASCNVRGAIQAIDKSLSYSLEEYLPEPEIADDQCHTPGAIKELNKDIEKRISTWLCNFEHKILTNVTVIPPSVPWDASHFRASLSGYVCLHITNRFFAFHFTKMIAEQTFFANYYTLAKYSSQTALFETFARLSVEQELQFDSICQVAIWKILPSITKMIVAAEKYALAVKAAVLKAIEHEALGKHKKWGSCTLAATRRSVWNCLFFIHSVRWRHERFDGSLTCFTGNRSTVHCFDNPVTVPTLSRLGFWGSYECPWWMQPQHTKDKVKIRWISSSCHGWQRFRGAPVCCKCCMHRDEINLKGTEMTQRKEG